MKQLVVYENMKISYTLLVSLFLVLILVHSDGAELEVKGDGETRLAPKIPSLLNRNNSLNVELDGSETRKVDPVEKGKDQVEGVQNIILEKKNSTKQVESKESQNVESTTSKNDIVKKGEKKKVDKGLESKQVSKEGILPTTRKESFRGEECDPANECTDDTKELIACLRVPGNESPDLSLLIQNKGKRPLSVTISAPDFVWLEKSQIELQEKDNKKVKVLIRKGGPGNLIVLTAGNGNCSLDFRDLIAQSSKKETEYTSQSTYINRFKRIPSIGFICLGALLVMVSILTCVTFRRKHFTSNSKYQRLDMELPVSGGAKTDSDLNDGWDNNWSDGWDDEEAPKTPSMPVTPSLSSQGVSSRRGKKDGWKD